MSRDRLVKRGEPYTPTASEIRRACREIQARWSDKERRKRAGMDRRDPWTPPRVHLDESLLGWLPDDG